MDVLNKPQEIQPIAFEDIPTPQEHARDVRRIFRTFAIFAVGFLIVVLTGIIVAIQQSVPLPVIAAVSVMGSFICLVTFGISYAIPVGLVSLRRLEIAYRMGYFGMGQNRKAVGAMETIADRMKRETTPLPAGRRPVRED